MDTSASPEGLDGLVLEYLERVEAGEDGAQVLEALCARLPAQAEALQRGVALLRDTQLHPGPAGDGLPERIGPFRLLRRLGAGGMGVVYLAEQDAPRRQVALKLVRPDQLLFDGYRDRFRREIESAGRLAHPGVAAIHEMGEHDGVPWFSQEYVVGAPLSAVLAGVPARSPETLRGEDMRTALADAMVATESAVPQDWNLEFFSGTWVEVCLRVARQVAEALQHAHERGVLHRDIKPSNVLLTPQGRCVLVDFGLAALLGSDRLTRTGAQLGSLHYMPPEQVDNKEQRVGPSSDVYSLGVTLYELLTLRAPYSSQSVQRLYGMILEGGAPEARRVNPSISRDASVVCSTAMERSPALRYASAADFASDLAAVLAHRSIRAQPAGPMRRTARWTRRRPALAVAIAASFLVFLVAPTLFAVQRHFAARDLTAALERSEANYRSAVAAIERVMLWTADEGLEDVPGVQAARLHVIEEALELFAELQRTRPDDPDVRLQRARLEQARGMILFQRARYDEAEQALELAATELAAEADAPEARASVLFELAQGRYTQAFLAYDALDFERAEALGREVVARLRQVVELVPESRGYREDLAEGLAYLGRSVHHGRGPLSEPGQLFDESLWLLDELSADPAGDGAIWRSRASVLAFRADWHNDRGDVREAGQDWRAAVAASDLAVAAEPGDRSGRRARVVVLEDAAAQAATRLDEVEQALAWLELADTESGVLAAQNPDMPEFEEDRLRLQSGRAAVLRRAGRRAEARALLEAVIAERQARLDGNRASPGEAWTLATDLINLANYAANEERGLERYEEVLELLDRVDELLGPEQGGRADGQRVRRLRCYQLHGRGSAWAGLGEPDEVLRDAESLDALQVDEPLSIFFSADLWAEWYALSGEERGRQASLERFERAVDAGFEDLKLIEDSWLTELLGEHPDALELVDRVRRRSAER